MCAEIWLGRFSLNVFSSRCRRFTDKSYSTKNLQNLLVLTISYHLSCWNKLRIDIRPCTCVLRCELTVTRFHHSTHNLVLTKKKQTRAWMIMKRQMYEHYKPNSNKPNKHHAFFFSIPFFASLTYSLFAEISLRMIDPFIWWCSINYFTADTKKVVGVWKMMIEFWPSRLKSGYQLEFREATTGWIAQNYQLILTFQSNEFDVCLGGDWCELSAYPRGGGAGLLAC